MLRSLARAAALALCLTVAAGCATIVSHLPTVIAAVTDGLMVLDAIESFAERYFQRAPDADKEAKVRMALARARAALNVALRTAQGAEKLDQAQVDTAFADFKSAYTALLALVAPLGVTSGDSLAVRADGLAVPEPMALSIRVK